MTKKVWKFKNKFSTETYLKLNEPEFCTYISSDNDALKK